MLNESQVEPSPFRTTTEGLPSDVADVLSGRADPSTLSTPQPRDDEGKPPIEGQGGESGTKGAEEGKPAKAQVTPPDPSEDEIFNRMGFSESPEQKSQRLEREYSASSKEVRRVNQFNTSLLDMLKSQHVEVAMEDGVPVGLVMGEGYSKGGNLSVKFEDLASNEQALFENNPQAAVDLILDRARKGLTRVAPTLDRAPVSLSSEREAAAISHVLNMVEVDGEKRHPNFDKNLPFIKRLLSAPNAPKALREFIAQEPEMALELLDLRVDAEKNFLKSQAQKALTEKEKKAEEARQTLSPGPAGGGTPGMAGNSAQSDYWGKRIAAANG